MEPIVASKLPPLVVAFIGDCDSVITSSGALQLFLEVSHSFIVQNHCSGKELILTVLGSLRHLPQESQQTHCASNETDGEETEPVAMFPYAELFAELAAAAAYFPRRPGPLALT
jgi:hypothetical protein